MPVYLYIYFRLCNYILLWTQMPPYPYFYSSLCDYIFLFLFMWLYHVMLESCTTMPVHVFRILLVSLYLVMLRPLVFCTCSNACIHTTFCSCLWNCIFDHSFFARAAMPVYIPLSVRVCETVSCVRVCGTVFCNAWIVHNNACTRISDPVCVTVSCNARTNHFMHVQQCLYTSICSCLWNCIL